MLSGIVSLILLGHIGFFPIGNISIGGVSEVPVTFGSQIVLEPRVVLFNHIFVDLSLQGMSFTLDQGSYSFHGIASTGVTFGPYEIGFSYHYEDNRLLQKSGTSQYGEVYIDFDSSRK